MRIVRYNYPSYRGLAAIPAGLSRAPWSGLESEIDRLFAGTLAEFGGAAPATRLPVDLYEDESHTFVRAELPGVNREDIHVEMTDGALTITAARKTPATDGQPEQSFSFSRSVMIPAEVSVDQVGATYENGVLTVTLPKREEAKPRKISVAIK